MSDRLPSFSSTQLIKVLGKLGFIRKKGGKGSHTKLEHPTNHHVMTVPKSEHLGVGLRTRLIKDLEKMGYKRTDLFHLFILAGATLFQKLFDIIHRH